MPVMVQVQEVTDMWEMHEVELKVISPIHIGWKKLGNLQQTRPYVIGRTIWGALTNSIVQLENIKNHIDIKENFKFSYFYPFIKGEKVNFHWDNPEEFEWKYISSYVSTAIEKRSAVDNSLHETEFISPITREGDDVYLKGYIFTKNEAGYDWKKALNYMQLGGERTYGWGRVELEETISGNRKLFEEYEIDTENEEIIVNIKPGENEKLPILAHTKAEENDLFDGDIEPLVGLEHDGNSFGKNASVAEICWIPGTKIDKKIKFKIGDYGIWEKSDS